MVTRIVHGNKVNAELLPWHFSAKRLKTSFRFVGDLDVFDSTLSAFEFWQHESPGIAVAATQASGLPGPIFFEWETVLVMYVARQAFGVSEPVGFVSLVPWP